MKIRASIESLHLIQLTMGERSLYLTLPQAELLMKQLKAILGTKESFTVMVKKAVCDVFECSMQTLCSSSRKEHLALARWTAYRIMRDSGMTLQAIGVAFNRDHGTVEHGLLALENRIATGYKSKLDEVRELIKSAQLSAIAAPKDS